MPPWIVYWVETEIDGLRVRISGEPEDRQTQTIHTADIRHLDSGEWLATAFRLTSEEAAACLYSNYRYRDLLTPRTELLLKGIFQFQADIRAGEVNACIDQPKHRP
jgi:hypothetical protein